MVNAHSEFQEFKFFEIFFHDCQGKSKCHNFSMFSNFRTHWTGVRIPEMGKEIPDFRTCVKKLNFFPPILIEFFGVAGNFRARIDM
jgi:hypothetical protein